MTKKNTNIFHKKRFSTQSLSPKAIFLSRILYRHSLLSDKAPLLRRFYRASGLLFFYRVAFIGRSPFIDAVFYRAKPLYLFIVKPFYFF